ncbi:hypothetical protein POM88_021137 [Heracleum sosnowskyi]|uniref:Uncharacterized protein n=1 Tax=Heracleum sosnowskyi TaxID=360622 RepID=A0AAD8MSI6_9APIA|nr:hypothetical protein POM88_021137 [Heracleum sosnowskyi]
MTSTHRLYATSREQSPFSCYLRCLNWIFLNKMLRELDDLVSPVPYVHLMSHPTWNSQTSSWTLSVNVEGEGAGNVVGLFKGTSARICSINRYNCELPDLPMILLRQHGSRWAISCLICSPRLGRDNTCWSCTRRLSQMFGSNSETSDEGVSLLISRKLVKLMNGDVHYLREAGKSTFIISVELAGVGYCTTRLCPF